MYYEPVNKLPYGFKLEIENSQFDGDCFLISLKLQGTKLMVSQSQRKTWYVYTSVHVPTSH